jgi:hypothetical protein
MSVFEANSRRFLSYDIRPEAGFDLAMLNQQPSLTVQAPALRRRSRIALT